MSLPLLNPLLAVKFQECVEIESENRCTKLLIQKYIGYIAINYLKSPSVLRPHTSNCTNISITIEALHLHSQEAFHQHALCHQKVVECFRFPTTVGFQDLIQFVSDDGPTVSSLQLETVNELVEMALEETMVDLEPDLVKIIYRNRTPGGEVGMSKPWLRKVGICILIAPRSRMANPVNAFDLMSKRASTLWQWASKPIP